MDPADLVTLAGLSVAVTALMEIGKKLLKPDPALLDRFGPFIAMALGAALGAGAAIVQGLDPVPAVLNGVLAGLAAVGIFKGAQASPLPIG